jgi:selenocysteine-specific elongation factor
MTDQRDLVLGTAGHIDHGKTALVRALTGVDTDRLPAERQRGISIDLGFAPLKLGRHSLALVDAPGHERFIRNMLAGASGLDLAMLVVAADDSVMPQTREHLEILCLLDLAGGVIALTKCDLVEPSWLALLEEEVRALVAETFLENAEMIRTSVVTAEGIASLREGLERLCDRTPQRTGPALFRMPIDRSFSIAGHGTVVTGSVVSGEVAVGDELEWLPEGKLVRVKGIQRHDQWVERVGRGARGALNLAGVHHDAIRRGHEVAAPGYLAATRILSVTLRRARGEPRPLRHRGRYRLHIGTAEVGATLCLLESNELTDTSTVLGQLFLAEPAVAVHGQPFVLRSESPPATLGGGLVIQPRAHRIRRRDAATVARLRCLADPEPVTRLTTAMSFAGLAPTTHRSLARDSGVAEDQVTALVANLVASGRLVEIALGSGRTIGMAAETMAGLEDRVVRSLTRLHAASPRHATIVRSRVVSALADLGNDALVNAIIDRLKARGAVIGDAKTVALVDHRPNLSQRERALKEELAAAFRAGGLSPPDPDDWMAKGRPLAAAVPDLIRLLVDEQQLVEIGPQLYFDHEAVVALRRRVVERLSDGSSITMAALRDLLGTTRKYAVPLGEYLDRLGLTAREGDLRRLGDPFAGSSPRSAAAAGGPDP